MKFTAGQIVTIIGGEIQGDIQKTVSRISKIEEAIEGDLSFIANPKYEHYLTQTQASIVLVQANLSIPKSVKATLIKVEDPYSAFAKLLEFYQKMTAPEPKIGIEQPVYISDTAAIGEEVYIGAFAYLGQQVKVGKRSRIFPQVYLGNNVQVGEHTVIYPGVKIYDHCKIGNNVIIHAGAVIGADGFGFAPEADGSFKKVPQLGRVVIEDDVEIGANTCIDRATIGETRIDRNVKLDNLIQIAHNVHIGDNTAIAAQAGVSGSTHIGRNCIIGGQAGLVGHIHLADKTRVNAQSGISKSVSKSGIDLTGSPAFSYREALKSQVIFKKLPELLKRIEQLEKQIQAKSATESKQ